MNFIYSTQQAVTGMLPEPTRAVLKYMLANAVGHKNAKTGIQIAEAMARQGIRMSKHKFQTTVLRQTRLGRVGGFIGSSREGVFLIETEDDYQKAEKYYIDRIAAETTNLDTLRAQKRAL